LARAGADIWNLDHVRADLAAETRHSRHLTDRDETVLRRIAIKEDLIAVLIAGRTDLADVAARFLDLNGHEAMYLNVLRSTTPGDSDLERAARNVIDYAVPRAADPAARTALRHRLEAELARMQDADHPAVR
jgi:hypothetical protein